LDASPDKQTLLALLAPNIKSIGAVEAYRVTMPLTYLSNRTEMRCEWMTVTHAMEIAGSGDINGFHQLVHHDIIILHRLLTTKPETVQPLCNALRCAGAKLVYEVDDDYSGRHRDVASGTDSTWAPYLPLMDAITTTCKGLAEELSQDSDGVPVYILPNHLELDTFSRASLAANRIYEGITVMLAGTQTHYQDWEVVAEVMPGIMADHPDVTWLVAGFCPAYLGPEATFIEPVPFSYYPGILAQADILCCALEDDPFNQCKSPVKALEGWAASRHVGKRVGGCAVIASKVPAYKGTVQQRHNGLLVDHTPAAWDKAIRLLVSNEYLRRKLQLAGHKSVQAHNIALGWQNWRRVYNQILLGAKL